MKLSEELSWRGFCAETTIKDIKTLDEKTHNFYLGADPSADSLTIGNLAALMMCACFARHGYKPYLLVGGATGQIGDPKDTGERDLKPIEEVEFNKNRIGKQMTTVLARAIVADNGTTGSGSLLAPAGEPDGGSQQASPATAGARAAGLSKQTSASGDTTVLDNYDWFKDINYLDFLRTVGKSFSMTQLLDRQFIQARIGEGGSGISYAEFSYTLIQGYDFLHLYREYGVDLQLCGADQYGNASSGIHLIKRFENTEANVWSTPLVIDPVSGRKFGKSEGNAVWLAKEPIEHPDGTISENFTPVFDFYQFWLNQPDTSVEYLMKFYTIYDKETIESILKEHENNPGQRIGQKALAKGVTEVVHGKIAAEEAIRLTEVLFNKSAIITEDDLKIAKKHLKTAQEGINVIDALVETGLAKSKTEARNFVKSGAVSLITPGEDGSTNAKITAAETTLDASGLLKKGKNNFSVIG